METLQKAYRELQKSLHVLFSRVTILYTHDQNEKISIGTILLTKLCTVF